MRGSYSLLANQVGDYETLRAAIAVARAALDD